MIKVKTAIELRPVIKKKKEKLLPWHISNGFSSFFQSYTRAINKAYNRTGPIFESPFKRIEVDKDTYYTSLITYVHRNPQKHGIAADYSKYKYSSYQLFLDESDPSSIKVEVLNWFGGKVEFIRSHGDKSLSKLDKDLILE